MQRDAEILQEYESWHKTMARRETRTESGLFHPWHQSVARNLPALAPKRILEIGCGRGDFTLWLADHSGASEIVGTDFSRVAIATAQQRAADRGQGRCKVSFEVGDAQ